MSSGHTTVGKLYPGNVYYRDKVWSGSDGKGKNNPYSCTITSRIEPAQLRWVSSYTGEIIAGGSDDFPYTYGTLGVPAIPDVELKLASKLIQKVGAFDFNPVISLAEGRETVSMLKGVPSKVKRTALSCFKAFVAIKERKYKRAFQYLRLANRRNRRILKNKFDPSLYRRVEVVRQRGGDWLTASFLEFRYGWQPLLSDIHSALKFIENECKKSNADQKRFVCRSFAMANNKRAVVSSPFAYEVSRVSIRKEQLVAYVRRENNLTESLEFAVADPAVIAWELLPFSFAVDWFVSIGPWLQARSALMKIKATYVRTTTTHQFCNGLTLKSIVGPGVRKILVPYDNYVYEITKVNRNVSQTFNIPLPAWHLPFKNELLHLADSLAIFHQLRISAK